MSTTPLSIMMNIPNVTMGIITNTLNGRLLWRSRDTMWLVMTTAMTAYNTRYCVPSSVYKASMGAVSSRMDRCDGCDSDALGFLFEITTRLYCMKITLLSIKKKGDCAFFW